MKAKRAEDVKRFTDIPNVGPRMADDFAQLGIKAPEGLKGKDPLMLYKKMCRISDTRQDPCVLDTYMAAINFMDGKPAKPWWHYTEARKREHPNL